MSQPFFSVVIPTKNRSFLVGDAIKSVLRQTFPDFELVVVDNDDTDATQKIVASFNDPRVRRVRTGGLSMPDNWEAACAAARGEYLCVLEDKQALKGRALERVYREAERDRSAPVKWLYDVFNDAERFSTITQVKGNGQARTISSERILEQFNRGRLWEAARLMPIPHLGAVPRSVLARIKEGPMKRLCPPVSPDFTLAFQQLAFADHVLFIEEALVVASVRHSNGRNIMMKSELAGQFTRELGGNDRIFYTLTPIKVKFVENSIYNDYLNLQQAIQGRLLRFQIDWANYFVEIRRAVLKAANEGVNMAPEKGAWKAALKRQPQSVQHAVYERLRTERPLWRQNAHAALKRMRRRTGLLRVEGSVRSFVRTLRGKPDKGMRDRFASMLEYVEWADSQAQKN